MIIFALEYGEYDEYVVLGVFSTRENAEKVREKFGGEVSEWILDPAVKELNEGKTSYHIVMHELEEGEFKIPYTFRSDGLATSFCVAGTEKGHRYIHATVWAKSEREAIGIVKDWRAEQISKGCW